MQAVAKLEAAPGHVCAVELDAPCAGRGEAIVRTIAGGVCGTDLAIYRWSEALAREYRPSLPLVMGHEFAGVVESVPAGEERIKTGQLVAVNPYRPCGTCFFCATGRHSLCDSRKIMGCHVDGGWAELTAAPLENLCPLPDATDPVVAAIMEPLSVAVHAATERVPVPPGGTVLVTGAGPVGLLHGLVAQASGARHVVIGGIGADRSRLALASDLGLIAVNGEEHDVPSFMRRLDVRGADAAYETSGAHAALEACIRGVRKGGRIALVGFAHQAAREFRTLSLVLDEKELVGCRAYHRGTWTRSIALLEMLATKMRRLVSHVLPFSAAQDAMRLIEERECLKVVIRPDALVF